MYCNIGKDIKISPCCLLNCEYAEKYYGKFKSIHIIALNWQADASQNLFKKVL